MIFAIIQNETVINVIVADEKFIKANKLEAIDVSDLEIRPEIGDSYIDGVFVKPVVDDLEA